METNFIIDLREKAQVPIITFSAKSPSLASLRSSYFFRVAANDSAQVGAIGAIVKAFGWRQVVPIYVDNEYGEGVIPYLTDALQAVDARVPYRSVIPPAASDDYITAELYKLMTMPTRVFVVHMLPDLGSRIFAKAEEIGMMSDGYVWIVTDGISDFMSTLNSSVLESMLGILGVKSYAPKTKALENFTTRFHRENPTVPLVVFGLWAYDTVFALAIAVEEITKTANFNFKRTNFSRNSTDLESFGISEDGPELVEALSRTRFRGLSGDFKLVNGQLQTPTYEIINVNGSGERRLGFWTFESGLMRKLDLRNRSTYSTSNTSLGPIIWPGDSNSIPKGWQIPTQGKRLKIGVPVKKGFEEFVNVSFPFSNDTVTGYSIDVFKAVLGALPYSVSFEFVPFANAQGKAAGTYNDFVYQVFVGNLDAAIGDITIRANRSLYVDFTLPYTESGEKVVSNLARFVVIIWCFVVLILTQSYTASLTSLLTVQQLQPRVTDVNQLLKNRENVGFQSGSFVEGILKQLGFDESQFKRYNSPEELYKLFANGSRKGGISAAFDENPYMKLFLAKYCSKFTMVEPTFKADGFAFVFPKGSPLVPDISRAILTVTEGNQMKDIEKIWFKKEPSCPDPNNKYYSQSLGLESFKGLFLIAGITSLSALIIYVAMFLYEQRDVFMSSDLEASLWKRIQTVFINFDQKDLRSHTFKKSEVGDRCIADVVSSPNTNCPPSPSSYSVHTDSNFVFTEQGTPSGTENDPTSPNGAQSTDEEIVSDVELTFPRQMTSITPY
ncbi:Glutamate receptor 2.4 [Morus notabilis]|uniref:Glutamate receptor n=1 Tax=Morus notabilis TaxID=981085 RepID=W9R728_9ROSA|nr:Glutamate receptor 2.4 [Morus notabilis]